MDNFCPFYFNYIISNDIECSMWNKRPPKEVVFCFVNRVLVNIYLNIKKNTNCVLSYNVFYKFYLYNF